MNNIISLKKRIEKALKSAMPRKVTCITYSVHQDADELTREEAKMDALAESRYDGAGMVMFVCLEHNEEEF